MISFPTQTADDQGQLRRIENGLRLITVPFPHFAGLARAVRVSLDERVPTMGIFASGRLVANPRFVRQLKENELVFVLAHELFHLALRTHDRAVGSDPLRFNYAHDYIINDILRDELGFQHIPAGGLDWPGARRLSAEEILLEMEKDPSKAPPKTKVWQLRTWRRGGPLRPAPGAPTATCSTTSSSASGSPARRPLSSAHGRRHSRTRPPGPSAWAG